MSIINLYEKSENLFFVGGIVRDELLGIKSQDIDLTYVGNAVDFFKNLDYKITQINEEFGSVHIEVDEQTIDITSTRTETYPKRGHLPVVDKIGCSLKEDVKRRDFTVNAIAKNCQTGEIVDYVGGVEDLKNKKLRILHENSFIDDPTRILRALKFSVRFNFELEENTKKLQNEYLKNVNYDVSFKRLKDELRDAFNINKQEVLNKFKEQKIYKLLSDKDYTQTNTINIEEFIKPYLNEIKYVWLLYLGEFDLSNIPMSKKENSIFQEYDAMKVLDGFNLYKKFQNSNIESILLYGINVNNSVVKDYLDNLRNIKLNITAKDLIDMGYEPSKNISETLDYIMQTKYANPKLTKPEEFEIAKKRLFPKK